MAASDKPFNNQRTLDIVFGVSNILMLLSVGWMLYDDHYRPWKVEQRYFRNVEVAMAQRAALDSLPSSTEFDAAWERLKSATKKRDDRGEELKSAQNKIYDYRPARESAEATFQAVKADVESFTSLLYIAIEHGDKDMESKYRKLLTDS